MYENLMRGGVVNASGEAPLLVAREKAPKKSGHLMLTFQIVGVPLEKMKDMSSVIAACIGMYVVDIQDGAAPHTYIIDVVADNALPAMIEWTAERMPTEETKFVLGEAIDGPVYIDVQNDPGILVAGATGSGKSIETKVILAQAILRDYFAIIADYKYVEYTLEIEDVWFEGIYNITVDEDGYSFRFRQFGNERDVNKREIYISDDEMAGYLNVSEGYNESDITSPLIAKLVDDSDYIYNAIIDRAIEYGENDRETHLLWVQFYFATYCYDDNFATYYYDNTKLEITNVKKIGTRYEGRFSVLDVNFRFVYEEDEQWYEITKLAYEDDPFEAWDDFEEYLGRARDYIWSKIHHYIADLEKENAPDENI